MFIAYRPSLFGGLSFMATKNILKFNSCVLISVVIYYTLKLKCGKILHYTVEDSKPPD